MANYHLKRLNQREAHTYWRNIHIKKLIQGLFLKCFMLRREIITQISWNGVDYKEQNNNPTFIILKIILINCRISKQIKFDLLCLAHILLYMYNSRRQRTVFVHHIPTQQRIYTIKHLLSISQCQFLYQTEPECVFEIGFQYTAWNGMENILS